MKKWYSSFLIGLMALSSVPVLGQSQLVRPALGGLAGSSASFEQALRAGGQSFIRSSMRVGNEALEAGMLSRVGKVAPTRQERLKCLAYEWCAGHLNASRLEKLVARNLIQAPFPGYYRDFTKEWKKFRQESHNSLRTLEVVLEAAYGEGALFEGHFVSSYQEVLALLQGKTKGSSALEALKQAFAQAQQKKTGFFLVTLQETEQYGHDVLLLDLKNTQFISLGQSIGRAYTNRQDVP